MTEFFLRLIAKLAEVFHFLMPMEIRLSMMYLKSEYKAAFLENDLAARTNALRHLALLRQKIHPPKECFIVDVKVDNDIPLKVNVCQQYCGDMYYGIGFEQSELSFVKHFVGDGDLFFDVGANVGVYTLMASRLVGDSGQVHAFEPFVDAYGFLQRNVDLNLVKNVTLNPVAVGEKVGEENLFVNAQSALTGLGRTKRGVFLDVQKVPVWTLDHYVKRSGIRSIDFLKIDVEGFEGHVLRGAIELLSNSPNLIVMSELAKKNFEPLGFSVKDVIDWMRSIGFEVWMIRSDSLSLQYVPSSSNDYPFQNFVFIRRTNDKYDLLKNHE